MKAYIYLPWLIFFTVCQPVRTKAQSNTSNSLPSVWTIGQCIGYAKQHNIQINALQLSQQTAQQNADASRGAKIPAVSGTVTNTFNNANNRVSGNSSLTNQLISSGIYSVNSSVVLWNDNYINNNIREQSLITQSASLSVQEAQNNIVLSVTQAFLNILLAKENEKYIAELVRNTDSAVLRSKQLFDAGSIAKVSLLQIQAQLSGDKYLLVQAQNTIRLNILALKQLLQLPADTPFDITTVPPPGLETALPALRDAQQAALQNFPEVKIGRLGMDIASLNIALAKAAFKPTIKANAALGSGYSDVIINNVNPKTAYFKQTGNNFYQTIGVKASIPIFAQRVNRTNLQKAKIAYQQAGLNLQNYQLVLTQAVEQAYLNASNARLAFDAASQQFTAAAESYRIVRTELKLGAVNVYDLLQQRNQYVQALQAFTQARYTAILQQKIYEFYMGKPVTL